MTIMNHKSSDRNEKNIIFLSLALLAVWSVISFLCTTDIFLFPATDDRRFALAVSDYIICRIIAAVAMFFVSYATLRMILSRQNDGSKISGTVKYALFYLPVIIAAAFVKLPAGYLSNDELAIVNDAVNLIHDTWFTYLTVYYYIVSFMLIPVKYGPIFVKLVIEVLVAGYVVSRFCRHYGKRAGLTAYLLFLLYPVIAYTTSAHRLPIYFLLYLFLFVKLMFDRLEKMPITRLKLLSVLLLGAVLTQWRTEGIYLFVLVPILLFMVYPDLRNKKSATALIASYIAIQLIVSIPQNFITGEALSGQANDRMKPFYAYTITNMMRNGLDRSKNAEDLEIIDRYISIESMDRISEHFGDINYEDVLILFKDEFTGVRPEAGYTEYYDFSEAVRRIFMNNPDVFIRTRWNAFCYAAVPYPFSLSLSGLKSLAYNLFIPASVVLAVFTYSLIRRRWFDFFVSGGLICHWFIVFILAPASYFKYYFPVYIMAYLYVIKILAGFIHNKLSSPEAAS